jgi:hypothetical protein
VDVILTPGRVTILCVAENRKIYKHMYFVLAALIFVPNNFCGLCQNQRKEPIELSCQIKKSLHGNFFLFG